jgi:hypothetical protein
MIGQDVEAGLHEPNIMAEPTDPSGQTSGRCVCRAHSQRGISMKNKLAVTLGFIAFSGITLAAGPKQLSVGSLLHSYAGEEGVPI